MDDRLGPSAHKPRPFEDAQNPGSPANQVVHDRLVGPPGPADVNGEIYYETHKKLSGSHERVLYKGWTILLIPQGGGNWVAVVANKMEFKGAKEQVLDKARRWLDENKENLK